MKAGNVVTSSPEIREHGIEDMEVGGHLVTKENSNKLL